MEKAEIMTKATKPINPKLTNKTRETNNLKMTNTINFNFQKGMNNLISVESNKEEGGVEGGWRQEEGGEEEEAGAVGRTSLLTSTNTYKNGVHTSHSLIQTQIVLPLLLLFLLPLLMLLIQMLTATPNLKKEGQTGKTTFGKSNYHFYFLSH
jgi:hypothetical protein